MGDIKFFRLEGQSVNEVIGTSMSLEKDLQNLFQKNLRSLMEIDFLKSEYKTTNGRIDMLGLDENKCPVIIEYKRDSNANIVTQGLFYLDWLMNHRDSFHRLVQEKIDRETADDIDWSAPRLVLVAADFNRYDVHAIKQIDRNIDLVRYRKFEDEWLMLDLLTRTAAKSPTAAVEKVATAIGDKRDFFPRKNHKIVMEEASDELKDLYESLKEFLYDLGVDVQERHLKYYVAFRRIKNFACVNLRNQKGNILVFVNGDIGDIDDIEPDCNFIRDVSDIGHYGTGNIEITIASNDDLERAKPIIRRSYERA
ncbi:endonuclease NucS domain-containing protein [Thioalkalivibrio sp. HK1]|uniref:endonuclease NucS domain-containing protein n=1 Tax=Thioalkalivibrio sp. HK1 TaxID=1469245 RepID=UPI000471AA30|nr:endonuclease NucS domain-containing protein [Thioalkalivibrio sp. HK1]